jgi:hypothetical protein
MEPHEYMTQRRYVKQKKATGKGSSCSRMKAEIHCCHGYEVNYVVLFLFLLQIVHSSCLSCIVKGQSAAVE